MDQTSQDGITKALEEYAQKIKTPHDDISKALEEYANKVKEPHDSIAKSLEEYANAIPEVKKEKEETFREKFEKTKVAKYLRGQAEKERDPLAPVKTTATLIAGIPAFVMAGVAGIVDGLAGSNTYGGDSDVDPNMVGAPVPSGDTRKEGISFNDRLAIANETIEKVGSIPTALINSEQALSQFETAVKPMEWIDTAGRFYGDLAYERSGDPDKAAAVKTGFELIVYFVLPKLSKSLIKGVKSGNVEKVDNALKELYSTEEYQKLKAGIESKTKDKGIKSQLEKKQNIEEVMVESLKPEPPPKKIKVTDKIAEYEKAHGESPPIGTLTKWWDEAGYIKKETGAGNLKKAHKILIETDPNVKKVHAMEGKAQKKPLKEVAAEGLSKANINFLDRFAAMKPFAEEAYKGARTHAAYKDIAAMEYAELGKGLKSVRDAEGLFTEYVKSKRALVRADRGMKNPAGVTAKEARAAMEKIEGEFKAIGREADLQLGIDNFHKWTHDNILKASKDAGLISKDLYNGIKDKNSFYAAFEILDHIPADISKIPTKISGEYFSVGNEKIFKKMSGTEKKMANPIDSTMRKFVEAKGVIARNRVANLLIDEPSMSQMIRPVAEGKQFTKLQKAGADPVRPNSWSPKDFDTVTRFKDGVPERYLVPKTIADAMKQMTPRQAPKAMMAINNIFRQSATTAYLPFTISNAMRDGLMAYNASPVYKAAKPHLFMADVTKGLYEGFKHEFLGKSKVVPEYIAEGRGGFGYAGTLRQTRLARKELFKQKALGRTVNAINVPGKLFSTIEKFSSAVELAPRVAIYTRAKKMGLLKKDAGLLARASTVDFNRAGVYTRAINQWVPFLNARVQGRLTLASALKNKPGETAAKIFTSVAIPAATTYAWNRLYFSDLYDDIPEHVKDNYFCFILGEGKDKNGKKAPKYITIAKGDVGQMAWNPVEFALDSAMKKDPERGTEFLINWLSDLSPVDFAREGEVSGSKFVGGFMPPVAKGTVENLVNFNFYTGRNVVPDYLEKTKAPGYQAFDSTPENYRKLGQKFNISPLKIQNFMSSIFAGYGREGLDPKSMLRGLTGRLLKTKGGAIEQRAFKAIEDIDDGYILARSMAEEAVKEGDKGSAIKIMNKWNSGLNGVIREFNSEFEDKGLREKGGLRTKYMFTSTKRSNMLRGKKSELSPIEKRLRK